MKKRNIIEQNSYLTKTMKRLCLAPLSWQNIPLHRICNQILIMLTGLVTDEQRKLTRGELQPLGRDNATEETLVYPGCKCIRKVGMTDSTLLHRLTLCPRYQERRENIFGQEHDIVGKINRIILGIDHSMTAARLLKKLSKVAI